MIYVKLVFKYILFLVYFFINYNDYMIKVIY